MGSHPAQGNGSTDRGIDNCTRGTKNDMSTQPQECKMETEVKIIICLKVLSSVLCLKVLSSVLQGFHLQPEPYIPLHKFTNDQHISSIMVSCKVALPPSLVCAYVSAEESTWGIYNINASFCGQTFSRHDAQHCICTHLSTPARSWHKISILKSASLTQQWATVRKCFLQNLTVW